MAVYLANAFSLNMLPQDEPEGIDHILYCRVLPLEMVQRKLQQGFVSAIGHADTARLLSDLLGREVPVNRITVTLTTDDEVIVAQYIGPRLPEGATQLPEGARFQFWLVRLWK